MKATVNTRPFNNAVRQYTDEVKDMIERESKKSADQLAARVKRVAPRDTGALESAVDVQKVEGGYAVLIGGAQTTRKVGSRTYVMKSGRARRGKPVDYAKVQEYGAPSMNIPAQPYYNPARSKVRRAYNRRIRSQLNMLAKKASGK